eukprot:CFRG0506T1
MIKMDSGYVRIGTVDSDHTIHSPENSRYLSRHEVQHTKPAFGSARDFAATYLGSCLVPRNSINLRTVHRKVDAVLNSNKEPTDISLSVAEIQISMLCEARDIIIPCRRLKGCATELIKGALLVCLLEEVRQGQFFCHVVEFRDVNNGNVAFDLIMDRLVGNELLI